MNFPLTYIIYKSEAKCNNKRERKNNIPGGFGHFVYFKREDLFKKDKGKSALEKYIKCFDENTKNGLTFCENYCNLIK